MPNASRPTRKVDRSWCDCVAFSAFPVTNDMRTHGQECWRVSPVAVQGNTRRLSTRICRIQVSHSMEQLLSRTEADGADLELLNASRRGDEVAVRTILLSPDGRCALEAVDRVHGWTPLFAACFIGHLDIVRMLLDAGAQSNRCDAEGWTAREIAAFKGHMPIAELLLSYEGASDLCHIPLRQIIRPNDKLAPTAFSSADELVTASSLRTTHVVPNNFSLDPSRTQIFISLGCSNIRSGRSPITFLPKTMPSSGSVTESKLFVSVRANGAFPSTGHYRNILDREKTINKPLHFVTTDPDGLALEFEVFESSSNEERHARVGKAVALLKELRRGLSSDHESLDRDHTIPILETVTAQYIGTLTFNILIVTSFHVEHSLQAQSSGFWKREGSTQVVGHRGFGANSKDRTHLQIGENTIQSFLTAAKVGATCVEFDVQLTRDRRTVIFHDFLVMELGADVPLQTLSFDQFMYLSRMQSPWNIAREIVGHGTSQGNVTNRAPRHRSHSLGEHDEHRINDIVQRMQLTEEGMEGNIKGNIRGFSIQEPATNLEQLLIELPENLPFNLEIKYPMLWEAEDRGIEPYAYEINFFVDTILKVIFANCGRRNITLSSFNPEICILLSCKQNSFPILFINKAGSVPAGDIRASSLCEAIEFAISWDLAGIVMQSDPFVMCPRLLTYAKDSGLVVGSYGNLNDVPHCAKVSASTQSCHQSSTPKSEL